MNKKIRIGNDIDIRWTLVDGDGNPYDLEGRDIAIEVVVNSKKRVRIKEWDVDENTVHFIYYGKDQKYTGPCDLKFIENDGEKEMVTFDTPAAFTLVSHSWQAVDDGEEPERIYLEYTTVTSELMERVGPKGDKGDKGEDGRDGRDGSDADVTAENIAAALGYVPADENAVPTTQEVTTTAALPLIRFSSDNPQVALISADWRGPLAIFHFNNSTGYYLYDFNGTVNHLYLAGGGFAVDVGIGTFRITHLAKKAAERVVPVARPFDEYIVDSHIRRIYSKPSSGIPASDLASGVIPNTSNFVTKSVNDLLYYYTKSETFTKEEVQALISTIQGLSFEIVSELPEPSLDTLGKIYLVPSADPQTQNIKDEYITIESGGEYSWEQIGSTDLSGYVTDEELAESLEAQTVALSDFALQGYEKTVYNTAAIQALSWGYYHIYDNGYYGTSNTYKNAILYVEPGDVLEIVSNSTNGTTYAFVTNYNKSTAEAAIPLPVGVSAKKLEAGESDRVIVPDGARAVRIALGSASNSYAPQSVTVWHNKTAELDWSINGDVNKDILFAPTNYRYNESDANNAFCTRLLKGHHYLVSADIGAGSYAKYSGISTKIPAADGSEAINGASNSSSSITGCNIYIIPDQDCFYTLSGASTSLVSNFKAQEIKSTDWAKIEDEALVTLLKMQDFTEVDLSALTKRGHCPNVWFGWYYLGSTFKHVRIPVTAGQYVKIVPGEQNAILAWLSDDEAPAQYAMPHYVQGTSSFRYLTNSGESYVKVPNGAQYLLVYLGESPYNYMPSFVGIYTPEKSEAELGPIADAAKQTLRHRIETRAQVNGLVPMIASIDEEGWELPQTFQQLNTIKKAAQLVKIKWTPKATLPGKNDPTAHQVGVEQTGIPYSGNWHDYKYVGIEVSLHTFMTAVNNPYSLLYTENVNKDDSKSAWGATYYNSNGWMYYGTVCCGFTASVNGQPTKYGNNAIPKVAETTGIFIPVYPQRDVNTIRIGDVANNSSHSFLVYAIHHDATGAIDKVKYAESTGANNSCRVITCNSPESFYSTLDRVGNPFVLYRVADLYKNVVYKPSPYVPLTDYGETAETVTYNNDICCFAGDRATFMEGNRVAINYNLTATPSQDWTSIELYKDDVLVETYLLSEIDQSALDESQQNHALDLGTTLEAGKYKARLTDGTNNSDYTYFEVLNNDITIADKGDGSYTIKVNSGEPLMYVYCGQVQDEGWFYNKAGREPDWLESDANEMRLYFDALLTDWGVDAASNHYVRVMLGGEYGMAATPPILLPGRVDEAADSGEEEIEETE